MFERNLIQTIEALRQSPPDLAAQTVVLKQLKNDLVGHHQRKEIVVEHGLVELLVGILTQHEAPAHGDQDSWSQEDDLRLQATITLGSLATGGTAFVRPLVAANAPQVLLQSLARSAHGHASRIVTATLQTLKTLAGAAASVAEFDVDTSVQLFDTSSIEAFHSLLVQPSNITSARRQVQLVAEIISIAASNEIVRSKLADSGVLDALASILASQSNDRVHPDNNGSCSQSYNTSRLELLPSVLSAICAIISNSDYRIHRFILSSPMRELFTVPRANMLGECSLSGVKNTRLDDLLPALQAPTKKLCSHSSGSNAFPALAVLQQTSDPKLSSSLDNPFQDSDTDLGNAVCGWLLYLARSMHGCDRLAALRLLALVNNTQSSETLACFRRSGYVQRRKEREKHLAFLAIPLVVPLLHPPEECISSASDAPRRETRQINEEACSVLALLVQQSKDLQASAVEVIPRICWILKKSFDSVICAKPMWPSRTSQAFKADSCSLGPRGLPAEVQRAMRCRQSALEALAALARKEDVHRKAIVDAGVAGCVIDSMKPFPASLLSNTAKLGHQVSVKDGNTTSVILAACDSARSMSRSVNLLRTSLIDSGIAKPTFELLRHRDIRVQIAATNVCCNLLLNFSPMREDLSNAGAIKTLAEHAKEADTELRFSSLWALKHLALSNSPEMKVQALEQLGAEWLVAAIEGEGHQAMQATADQDSVGAAFNGLSSSNAAGEQVDLLNPAFMDVDSSNGREEDVENPDEDGEILYDEASSTHYQASQLRSTLHGTRSRRPFFNAQRFLSSIRELEQDQRVLAKRNDIAIQEQALDFLRNLLNGEDCVYMVDQVLTQIGTTKLFALLTEKLAPLTTDSSNLMLNSSRPIYNPDSLILCTIHVIVHIANGSASHKQLLVAQKPLLQAWLPHFSHPDQRVRVMSIWAFNSLTWVENGADKHNAQMRVRDLKSVGIVGEVERMRADQDLDVKERVKVAMFQVDYVS